MGDVLKKDITGALDLELESVVHLATSSLFWDPRRVEKTTAAPMDPDPE